MRSESTRALGHPRLMKPTVLRAELVGEPLVDKESVEEESEGEEVMGVVVARTRLVWSDLKSAQGSMTHKASSTGGTEGWP